MWVPPVQERQQCVVLFHVFYDVTSGEIDIDGMDIRKMTQKSLRRNIGIVQQDVYLFAGTVKDNIRYGKPDATDEEIIAAAKNANAHEFIMQLPDGYNTDIGQRGVKLSGGQKQRLSLARVFLKNPPILIFDEATSALDNESEKIVQDSLEHLAKKSYHTCNCTPSINNQKCKAHPCINRRWHSRRGNPR